MFDYDAPVTDDAAAAVAADIGNSLIPERESDEDRERRLAAFELREMLDRERRAEARERAEFECAREQERQQQAARAEASRALREKMDQQQRERDARLDRQRIAAITAQHQADQARRVQAAREQAVANYWGEVHQLLIGLDRLCTPVQPDYTAQRIAALEGELEAEAAARSADAERARSAKFYSDQRAAVAKREAGGW
jgi:hypothetical protein